MRYALIGDIHSSMDELKKVLHDIEALAPDATVIGLGDLFECTISKKKLDGTTYSELSDVLLNPAGFKELLEFPSIRGNQEERIKIVSKSDESLLQKITDLPERISIGQALLIHGHQWPYDELPPDEISAGQQLIFYGHTHHSSWSIEKIEQPFQFGQPIALLGKQLTVNVGSVVDHKEWLLFDTDNNTITFMKVKD